MGFLQPPHLGGGREGVPGTSFTEQTRLEGGGGGQGVTPRVRWCHPLPRLTYPTKFATSPVSSLG